MLALQMKSHQVVESHADPGERSTTLAGKAVGLEANRGRVLSLMNGRQVVLTYHPSFLLRTPDKETQQLRYERLVGDLKLAAKVANE